MPNRVIRVGFLDSESVSQLDAEAECFYFRLLLSCDDAGRIDGRPKRLASLLYPIAEVREGAITRRLSSVVQARLVIEYEVEGAPYLQVAKWQRCGPATVARYPWKDGSYSIRYVEKSTRDGVKAFVDTSLHGIGNPSVTHANGIGVVSDTETETDTKTETKTGRENSVEPGGPSSAPSSRDARPQARISFNAKSGRIEGVTDFDLAYLRDSFPAVDVRLEVGKAGAWLLANPAKRKRDVWRFVTNWCARCQEKGGSVASRPAGGGRSLVDLGTGGLK